MASTLTLTRADRLIGRVQYGAHAAVVLGYHRVVDDFDAHVGSTIPAMLTSRAMLELHLNWLERRFRFVTLDHVGQHVQEGRPFNQPAVALTFDDGYRDFYEQAFPVLKRRGIPAAMFVATDFVDRQIPLAHDRLYLLVRTALGTARGRQALQGLLGPDPIRRLVARPAIDQAAYVVTTALLGRTPRAIIDEILSRLESVLRVSQCLPTAQPLTWPMLAEMQQHGVTVGCHTAGHSVLTSETPAVVADELSRSRAVLERRLGMSVRHFAYPDGRFNRAVVGAVAQSGTPFAYTTCRHQSTAFPALTIPRRLLWERSCLGPTGRFSPSIMSGHVYGVFELVGTCVENHGAGGSAAAGASSTADRTRRALATGL